MFVPDTNALLHNPDLDQWILAPRRGCRSSCCATVLAELDELKVNHRDVNVRHKAESLIGRVKS